MGFIVQGEQCAQAQELGFDERSLNLLVVASAPQTGPVPIDPTLVGGLTLANEPRSEQRVGLARRQLIAVRAVQNSRQSVDLGFDVVARIGALEGPLVRHPAQLCTTILWD